MLNSYLRYFKKYHDMNNPIKLHTLISKVNPVVIFVINKFTVNGCQPIEVLIKKKSRTTPSGNINVIIFVITLPHIIPKNKMRNINRIDLLLFAENLSIKY
tara:strand:- start:981 stop:1283 length:303 start_codon:yes stop_codon:yes gene_type:complete